MVARLPNIKFDVKSLLITAGAVVTAGVKTTQINYTANGTSAWGAQAFTGFDASLSNPVYGNSDTVTPLSLSTKFFIKY